MSGSILFDVPETVYHSGPELSSTGARRMLDSPARFKWDQEHQTHSEAFDLGTAVHSKVLGTGSDVELLDFDNWRSKAAQDAREDARVGGLIPMLRKDYQPVEDMAEAVLSHPTARALFEQDGHAEASVYATDPETGVDMRARFDWLPDLAAPDPQAVDLKTTGKDASANGFTKSVASFGYDVQESWYQQTLEFAAGIVDLPFVFVVVETAAPHLVGVHQLDVEWVRMGAEKALRAREIYAECQATNTWPGYATDIQLISPPNWLVYQHEDEYGPVETTIVTRL